MRTSALASTILLPALLAACDTPPLVEVPHETATPGEVASDDVVGGSRLRARWIGGPDGPVAPATTGAAFLDEALGEPCDFGLASDGVVRCLAGYRRGTAGARTFGGGSARYADPGCTDLVVDRTPGCVPPPRWLTYREATTCPVTIRVRKPGVKLEAGAPVYEQSAAGCVLSASAAGSEDWTLVDEDPTIFASAAEMDGPADGGFSVRLIVSEDGARQAVGLRPDGGTWVGVPALAKDGTTRLLPSGPVVWSPGGFADPTCSVPAMTGDCLAPGDFGIAWQVLDACRTGAAAYVIGEQLQQGYGGTACTAYPVGSVATFSAGGLLVETFPKAIPLLATARLQQPGFNVGEHWSWRKGFVVDAALGEEVSVTAMADGVSRWVPIWALGFDPAQEAGEAWSFADPGCTQRLLTYPSASCRTPGRWAVAQATQSCGAAVTVWTTEPWSGSALYTRSGPAGPCVLGATAASLRYRRLVAPAAVNTFAPATELLR